MFYKSLLCVSLASLLVGCFEQRDPNQSMIPIGSKQVLKEWPDQAYITAMDSMIKEEVVVGPQKKSDVTVALSETPMALNQIAKKAVKEGQAMVNPKAQKSAPTLEEFIEKFSAQIDLVRNGSSSGKQYQVKSGDTIQKILKKKYGSQGAKLPEVIVKYQLQGINPNLDLAQLEPGQVLLLPF